MYLLVKRVIDIVVSMVLAGVLIIPILIIFTILKVTSKDSAIYYSDRIGKNNHIFKMPKFRTMKSGAPEIATHLMKNADKHTTKIGKFLRKTSLDELPQFYNVIQGRMSIVGPRPHAVAHNEEYRKLIPKYMQRHLVKPGITGWAQINGWRGETDTLHKMKKRIDFDLHYINTWSLWLDIKIIILTTVKGFINKNAY